MLPYRALSITVSNLPALKMAPPEAPRPPLQVGTERSRAGTCQAPGPPAPALLRPIVEAVTDSVP
jgi:hypothetical protein